MIQTIFTSAFLVPVTVFFIIGYLAHAKPHSQLIVRLTQIAPLIGLTISSVAAFWVFNNGLVEVQTTWNTTDNLYESWKSDALVDLSPSLMGIKNFRPTVKQMFEVVAFDLASQRQLKGQFHTHHGINEEINSTKAQTVFCIDVRSEVYGRSLETVNHSWITLLNLDESGKISARYTRNLNWKKLEVSVNQLKEEFQSV